MRRLDIGGSPGSEHWSAVCWCRKYQDIYKYPASYHLNVNVYILDIYCNPSDQNSEELKHIKDVSNSISQSPNLERFYFGFVRF